MKIALFYYEGFVEFEIALALLLLRDEKVLHFAMEKKQYHSYEGQTMVPQYSISEVSPQEIDMLIIPGGDSQPLFKNHELKSWIEACVQNNGIIAGICGGAELLAGLGLLDGKTCTAGTSGIRDDDPLLHIFSKCNISNAVVEVDGLYVTSQGQGYAEFASKLYHLSIGGNNPEAESAMLKWLKNDRSIEIA